MSVFGIDEIEVNPKVPPIRWGWFVAIGVLVSALGVILLARPYKAVGTLAFLVAFALLFEAVELLMDARYLPKPVMGYVLGVIHLITAGVALAWPGITLWALAVVTGIGLIVGGVGSMLLRRDAARIGVGGLPLWVGILSIVAGVMTLVWPGATILVLAVILGVRVLGSGLALVTTGLALRKGLPPEA